MSTSLLVAYKWRPEMHSASTEMQSDLVTELLSNLGEHFESMGISKTMRDFECGVELRRDFRFKYLIRE